jgi:hypothetical protein
MNRNQIRKKIWALVAQHQTKSDFFQTGAIVDRICEVVEAARREGHSEVLDILSVKRAHESVYRFVCRTFRKDAKLYQLEPDYKPATASRKTRSRVKPPKPRSKKRNPTTKRR